MNSDDQPASRFASSKNWLLRGATLLLIGFLLTLVSDMRGSAGVFAWFMPIPFLLYAALYRGAKSRLWLLLVLVAASILTLAKTVSDPLLMSVAFSVMSGTVTGIRFFAAYGLWDYIHKWTGNVVGIVAFPVVIVSLEFVQAFGTPLGDWGRWPTLRCRTSPCCKRQRYSDS